MDYNKWLGSFFLVILVSSLLLILTPEGGSKKIANILACIFVFFSFLPAGNRLFSLSADYSYQDYLKDAEYTLEESQTKYKNEILRLTREKIEKQIEEQAASMGLEADVSVKLRLDQNASIEPESVYINHKLEAEEDMLLKLKQWIYQTYSIKPSRQMHKFK